MASPLDYGLIIYNKSRGCVAFTPKQLSFSTANDFVPRISSGVGETDLDGTLHRTLTFDKGSFQRRWKDDDQTWRAVGMFNRADNTLYPTLAGSTLTHGLTYTGTLISVSAVAITLNMTYVAIRENTTNRILSINSSGTVAALTLPAGLSAGGSSITSMVILGGNLFIASSDGVGAATNLFRYSITGATFTDMGGYSLTLLGVLRGSLYGIDANSNLYSITNETGTAVVTLIKQVGPSNALSDLPKTFIEFNGALWLAKSSGLYRFDGVTPVQIFKFYPEFMTEYNGAMYFMNNGWLQRFNGSSLEKIQYFGVGEAVKGLVAHLDNLAILTWTFPATYKYAADMPSATDARIHLFDGAYFYTMKELDTVSSQIYNIVSASTRLVTIQHFTSAVAPVWTAYNFSSLFGAAGASQVIEVSSPEFDADLPNITKLLRSVEVETDAPVSADSVTVSYSYMNAGTWSAYVSLGVLVNLHNSTNRYMIPRNSDFFTFKKIKFKIEIAVTTSSTISLRSFTLHYTAHPEPKRLLTVTVPIVGQYSNGTVKTNMDMTDESWAAYEEAWYLREYLRPANYGHSFILGPEYAAIQAAATAGDLAVRIRPNFQPNILYDLSEMPLWAFVNRSTRAVELVRVTGWSSTGSYVELFLYGRGMHSTTAMALGTATHVAMPVMEVGYAKILSERLEFDSSLVTEDSNSTRQIQREITVQFTEI